MGGCPSTFSFLDHIFATMFIDYIGVEYTHGARCVPTQYSINVVLFKNSLSVINIVHVENYTRAVPSRFISVSELLKRVYQIAHNRVQLGRALKSRQHRGCRALEAVLKEFQSILRFVCCLVGQVLKECVFVPLAFDRDEDRVHQAARIAH